MQYCKTAPADPRKEEEATTSPVRISQRVIWKVLVKKRGVDNYKVELLSSANYHPSRWVN